MLRIGIYGGSFSPIHNGHIKAVKAFLEQMQLDFCYVMPAGIPPHKSTAGVVDAKHRMRMCELAFEGVEGIVVSDLEIKREGKSYTVDTLRALAGEDRRLFLMMGTDMMLTLDKWYQAEEIFKLCYPVYMRRETDVANDEAIVSKMREYIEKYGKVVRRILGDPIVISSTEIREMIRKGENTGEYLPLRVAEYIKENRLYVGEE